jgi:hypothetical protein
MNNTTHTPYALETRAVVKKYQADAGTIFAVNDVSLQVAAGEFVALVRAERLRQDDNALDAGGVVKAQFRANPARRDRPGGMSDAERVVMRREKIGLPFRRITWCLTLARSRTSN